MSFSLNTLFQSLVPKDKKFFPLFRQASLNMVQIAETLRNALHADSVTRLNTHRRITELERQGDDITHFIMRESSQTFLTPFDREDIQELAHTLDDVTDYIHAVSKRIELYKIHQFSPAVLAMMDEIVKSCEALNALIHEMQGLRMTSSVKEHIAAIREAEKRVDVLFDDAVGSLFRDRLNAVEILKQKELLTDLAAAADRAEQTSSVVEAVLLKFS
ncbi:MAG: DUF47 domain-containing protein [Flavobacteriales bacterium]|jgi:predicted phosphate transport protein (TIGR00153 family)